MAWRPLACDAFIKIKLALCHLLLYVVYTYQNSFNFIDAFNCYKHKCKLAPFNLAHFVYAVWTQRQTNATSEMTQCVMDILKATAMSEKKTNVRRKSADVHGGCCWTIRG